MQTRFRLLGEVEVDCDGTRVALGGPMERACLAVLLLNRNRSVSREMLTDALWERDPPPSAPHALDVHVSRLRHALKACGSNALLTTTPGGYRLHVNDDDVDLRQFKQLVSTGLQTLASGAAPEAERLFGRALALIRGPALAEFSDRAFAVPEIQRIEELAVTAAEARAEASLAAGDDLETIAELEMLVAAHPLRERCRGLLMEALYRAGRQAEALQAYREGHAMLHELGLEPSDDLRRLELAILRHDPVLDAEPAGAR
jgi:DNA-binding SARP family transcriptional activator